MRTISIRLEDLEKVQIPLGFVGENKHTTILIDCKKVFDEYSDAIPAMTVNPPDGEAYPAIISRNGDIVSWEVTNSDLIYEGNGELQLSFMEGEVVARTYIGRTRVFRSIVPTGEVPEPLDDFLARASEALSAIPFTIYAALEEAKESGEFDGFSPIVNITTITGGHQISIQDATHTVIANVMDGAEGEPGVSPTITPSKSGDTLTITIVDKTGTKYAYLYDGTDGRTPEFDVGSVSTLPAGSSATVTVDITDPAYPILHFGIPKGDPGDPTELIDDTAGEGDTDKVWSADKTDTELSDVKSAITSLNKSKAPVIVGTSSGAVASFADGADGMPMKSVITDITPVQSGTGDPSPDNVRPITGWTGCNVSRTGKNLFDVNALRAGTFDTPQSFPTGNVANADYISLKPGEYTWSQIPYGVSGGRYVRFYNAKKELIDGVSIYTNNAYTFTTPDGTCYCKFMLYRSTNPFTSLADILALQPMVVLGSTESDYVPFVGTTYPISWQTEAGTVYGGTLDVTNGVLNVTTKLLDLGSVSWNKDDNRTGNFYTGNLSEVTNSGFAITCSDYKTNNSANANTISNGELSSYISYGAPRIFIKNTNYADYTGQQVTTALSGVKLVCTLATPQTYQLTPTEITALLGQNHVWADTGDADVTYPADTKAYVDDAIPSVPVQDVQVNGTSVLNQGVANVPVMGANIFGVAKTTGGRGISVSSDGIIQVDGANSNLIKAGATGYCPITPLKQHESIYYGLAKLANAPMSSLTGETIGQYPSAQLTAIQKMLGIYEAPWELIREDAVTCATESDIDITVDDNGSPFELTDIRMIIWFPVQNNDICYNSYHITFNPNAENYLATIDKKTLSAGSSVYSALAMIDQKDGMITTLQCAWGLSGANSSVAIRRTVGKNEYDYFYKLANVIFNHIRLNKVTGTINFRIYGKRKWRT